ncbi:hypothetical protein E2C01_072380 [Portunus trituberculatus]|uniref:Uncharacterized protein n=1 Tax=Portunus trituberculatus TaxID=210409 RepID=A0A5B7HXT9_PORTR|nr:hypothetical protein [Portunus trituberculatus]
MREVLKEKGKGRRRMCGVRRDDLLLAALDHQTAPPGPPLVLRDLPPHLSHQHQGCLLNALHHHKFTRTVCPQHFNR